LKQVYAIRIMYLPFKGASIRAIKHYKMNISKLFFSYHMHTTYYENTFINSPYNSIISLVTNY